ncbi:MAG: hypothetical protein JOY81_12930, partial [Alphaproteobacteria bacterium]|nr:hypothetical protein [Alphaproteobacteria bacterium]
MTLAVQADLSRLRAPLIEKLARFVDLTADERDCLSAVQADFFRVHDG